MIFANLSGNVLGDYFIRVKALHAVVYDKITVGIFVDVNFAADVDHHAHRAALHRLNHLCADFARHVPALQNALIRCSGNRRAARRDHQILAGQFAGKLRRLADNASGREHNMYAAPLDPAERPLDGGRYLLAGVQQRAVQIEREQTVFHACTSSDMAINGMCHAVLVARSGHFVSGCPCDRRSVAHCNAQSGSVEQRRVNVVVAERHHLIGRDVQRITQHMHGRVLARACRYNLQIFVLGAHKRHRQVLCLQYRNHFVNLRFLAHAEQFVRACVAPICKQRLQRRDGRLYAGYLCLCAAPFILGGNEPVEVAVNAQVDTSRLRFLPDSLRTCTGQAAVRQPVFARENKSSAAAHQRSIHAERIPNREHRPRRSCAHQADGHAVLRRKLHSLAVGERQLVRRIQKRAVNIHAQQPILLLIHCISSFMPALPPTKCWRHCGFRCGCPVRSQPRRPRTPAR